MAVSAASNVAAVVAAFGVSSQDTATGSTAVRAYRGGASRPGLLLLPREVLSPACVDHSQFLPSTLSIQAWNGTQPQLQCGERRHVFSEVEPILAPVTAVLHVGRAAFRVTIQVRQYSGCPSSCYRSSCREEAAAEEDEEALEHAATVRLISVEVSTCPGQEPGWPVRRLAICQSETSRQPSSLRQLHHMKHRQEALGW